MTADSDLPWYFGFAAKTWQGDAGLRSPLGGQLDAVRSGVHLEHGTADSWRAIEQADRRVEYSRRARRIEARLVQLTSVQVQALRLHYDPHATLPYEVDACAILLAASRVLVGSGRVGLLELRKALQGAPAAKREAIADQARRLAEAARAAYEGVRG